jgi:hypothetical protein
MVHYIKMWISWLQKYDCNWLKPIVYNIFIVAYVKMA